MVFVMQKNYNILPFSEPCIFFFLAVFSRVSERPLKNVNTACHGQEKMMFVVLLTVYIHIGKAENASPMQRGQVG